MSLENEVKALTASVKLLTEKIEQVCSLQGQMIQGSIAEFVEPGLESQELVLEPYEDGKIYYFCDGVVREGEPIGGKERCRAATSEEIEAYIEMVESTTKTAAEKKKEAAAAKRKEVAAKKKAEAAAKKKAEAAAKEKAEAEAAEEPEDEDFGDDEEDGDDGDQPTYEKSDVMALLTKATKALGDKKPVLDLLQEHGGQRRLGACDPETYGAIVTALEAAIKEAE